MISKILLGIPEQTQYLKYYSPVTVIMSMHSQLTHLTINMCDVRSRCSHLSLSIFWIQWKNNVFTYGQLHCTFHSSSVFIASSLLLQPVNLRKIDCQIFLQERQVIWDQLRIAIQCLSPCKLLVKSSQGRGRRLFYRGKIEVVELQQRVRAFDWLSPCGLRCHVL